MDDPAKYGIDDETWARIQGLCAQYHVRRFALFGSSTRDDFGPDSDIDVLVEFESGKTPGFGFFQLEIELAELLKRKVDLCTPNSIRRAYRESILAEARDLYVAA